MNGLDETRGHQSVATSALDKGRDGVKFRVILELGSEGIITASP
jgi:hypothetical protein